jgi:hypothetical protein
LAIGGSYPRLGDLPPCLAVLPGWNIVSPHMTTHSKLMLSVEGSAQTIGGGHVVGASVCEVVLVGSEVAYEGCHVGATPYKWLFGCLTSCHVIGAPLPIELGGTPSPTASKPNPIMATGHLASLGFP